MTSRPRSKGFTSPDDYLKHCEADVVFVFFGYNESFGGEKEVGKFKSDLGAMIDNYRGIKFNGESAPRFVLFSPIAHEDHRTRLLPNGNANNVNLALYTGAIHQMADEKGVGFVDLFSATQGASEDMLDENCRRMIINGTPWALGLEKVIKPDLDISFVGPYQPTTFSFDGAVPGVKPVDLAGWDSPIMPVRENE